MTFICDRCYSPATRPESAMRIAGRPLGAAGPRLLPTVLCGDCAALLARFLAGPAFDVAAVPSHATVEESPPPVNAPDR